MRENRVHRRLKFSFEFKCSGEQTGGFIAKCLDLSSGGLRAVSPKAPEPNEIINLEIPLQKNYPSLNLKGRVAWQKPYVRRFDSQGAKDLTEFGIKFLDIDNPTRRRIFGFIAEAEKRKNIQTKEIHTMTDMPF